MYLTLLRQNELKEKKKGKIGVKSSFAGYFECLSTSSLIHEILSPAGMHHYNTTDYTGATPLTSNKSLN